MSTLSLTKSKAEDSQDLYFLNISPKTCGQISEQFSYQNLQVSIIGIALQLHNFQISVVRKTFHSLEWRILGSICASLSRLAFVPFQRRCDGSFLEPRLAIESKVSPQVFNDN